jgi:hypothetical protein
MEAAGDDVKLVGFGAGGRRCSDGGKVVSASRGRLLQGQLPDLARAGSGTFDALEGEWRYKKCLPTAAHSAP